MRRLAAVILSVLVSGLLIWYLASQITAEDLRQTFAGIHTPALLAFMLISLIGVWLRAWRYKLLLGPHSISWGKITLVTLLRNLFVDLLPARIGSLSYIYFLNRRLKYSFEASASTFVIAFVFDFLTLSPYLILALIFVGTAHTTISVIPLLIVSGAFFAVIGIIIWKIIPAAELGLKGFHILLRLFKIETRSWARQASRKFKLTIAELEKIQAAGLTGAVLVISLFLRLAKYGGLFCLLTALLSSHGLGWSDLSFFKTILGVTGAELTSVLPVKGIAGFGTWESAWAFAFQLMNFDQKLAILSGIGIHLITNIFEYTLGIISLLVISSPLIRKRWDSRPS